MPHLVMLYTPDLDRPLEQGGAPMGALCRALADCMLAQCDEAGAAVFPPGGVRVLAYPAAHAAVADGRGDYGFVYLNLRMGRGRSAAVHDRVGKALEACALASLSTAMARRPVGVTLQIDVGSEVFDAKNSSLHPLFNAPPVSR